VAGVSLAAETCVSFADAASWLISGRDWVCTLAAANSASAVLMTKTPFMTPPKPVIVVLQTKLHANG